MRNHKECRGFIAVGAFFNDIQDIHSAGFRLACTGMQRAREITGAEKEVPLDLARSPAAFTPKFLTPHGTKSGFTGRPEEGPVTAEDAITRR